MKPVCKGIPPPNISKYEDAKHDLLQRLGEHCSYCERSGEAQDLHVEHIYPKATHKRLENTWKNFLLSCNTCNSYKNIYQKNALQTNLKRRFLWPHIDNTFRAFRYLQDGRITLKPHVRPQYVNAADETLEMAGLLKSPAKTAKYKNSGIAYDSISKRSQVWRQAVDFRNKYQRNPTADNCTFISQGAVGIGYFSIWMEVFKKHPSIRLALIEAFKADSNCFDSISRTRKKGRI